MLIRWRASRLHYKNVRTANIFADREVKLPIGKPSRHRRSKVHVKMSADLVRQFRVCRTGKNLDIARHAHLSVRVTRQRVRLSVEKYTEFVPSGGRPRSRLKALPYQNKNGCLRIWTDSRSDIQKLAGAEGFEPTNAASKERCLTTWRRPNANLLRITRKRLLSNKHYSVGRQTIACRTSACDIRHAIQPLRQTFAS